MPVSNATKIFARGLDAVSPAAMVQCHLKRHGDVLNVGERSYRLDKNVHVVGFGKAVAGMCRAVQDILHDHIVSGILSIPTGLTQALVKSGKRSMLPIDDGKIRVYEGAKDNLPDENSLKTTLKIIDLVKHAKEEDIVITLVSGGGSALLCAPKPPLSIEDKLSVSKLLMRAGASINDLNIVRKALSAVKGGKLAEMAHPAQMVTLILSDIIGDPLDLIASGPTVASESKNQQDCCDVLRRYNVLHKLPQIVEELLPREEVGSRNSLTDMLVHAQNVLVGTNGITVSAALAEAEALGFCPFILSKKVQGEAKDVGAKIIDLGFALANLMTDVKQDAVNFSNQKQFLDCYFSSVLTNVGSSDIHSWSDDLVSFCTTMYGITTKSWDGNFKRLCVVLAGETTVTLTGNGVGGRNQEMVLAAAIHFEKRKAEAMSKNPNFRLAFLSAGTDGQDGPTDATGAVFDSEENNFVKNPVALADAEESLTRNDSYGFLSRFPSALLKTGLTGTNVMDVQILVVELA